jgi:hypothetical protein
MPFLIKILAKLTIINWILLSLIVAITIISTLINPTVKGISNTDICDYLKISAILISTYLFLKFISKKLLNKNL